MHSLRSEARMLSKQFIANEKEYMLGFVEAEQKNPFTANLGEAYVQDTQMGIDVLFSADNALYPKYSASLFSREFDDFSLRVYNCISQGGRIVVSGCGATGRLAMRIEASWRKAAKDTKYSDSVIALMTGGDYALIRSVESFEDYIQLGRMQAKELALTEKDMLIGVTATGETTSILGTAMESLESGATVQMIICTKPESILGKLKRADMVYTHKNCYSLYIPCGGMAVTGSTRMQSSTIEQLIIASALETALSRLMGEEIKKETLVSGFASALNALKKSKQVLAGITDREYMLYEAGGHVTYFADEYLLDVLADTTERGPTFSVPPFRPQREKDKPLSWAFVKNPLMDTVSAWHNCFGHTPRCIEKTRQDYLDIGVSQSDIERIPEIGLNALYGFEIGFEEDKQREAGESLAVWIGDTVPPQQFFAAAKRYKDSFNLVVNTEKIVDTKLEIFQHILMKLVLNTVSTGTMAKMGRIYGNYMVNLNISNKKLVDRATRIIADLCNVSYDEANYQLYYSKLTVEGVGVSPVKATIDRLKKGKIEMNNDFIYYCSKEEFIKNAKLPVRVMDTQDSMHKEIARIMADTIINSHGQQTVIICPVGPIGQYPYFAEIVNSENISLKNCIFINMDEYLDENGNAVSVENALSFKRTMNEMLYSKVRAELLMPEENRIFPEPGKEKELDAFIDSLDKIDLCLTGVGINGHIAFNEPALPEEDITDEQFENIGTRCLDISKETITRNGSGKLMGALDIFPRRCVTLGMKQLLKARVFKVYLYLDWQWGIMRKAALSDVTRFAPVTYLQKHNNAEMVITEALYNAEL